MKVSQATINYYLKVSKVLSDGSHPIMLRVCFNGYKDVSSHYSCPLKHWDKKNQQVKRSFGSNYAVINYELNKLKSRIIAKRDEYIRLGIEYTPSMLLSNDDDEKKSISNVVGDLIDVYYKEKELKSSTVAGWKNTKSMLDLFHSGVIISEIDEGFCKRFAKWLDASIGLSEGAIRNKLGHIACIYRYAAAKGLVSIDRYPYRDWNYCAHYKLAERIQYIHQKSVDVMKEYFLSKVIKVSGKTFTFIDDGYINYKNRLFPLYFWLLGYYFQGLSPIDICLLKKSDFKVITVDGVDYWSINTSRQKTNVSVKIRIKKDTIYSQVMIGRMMMEGDGWFLPVMRGLMDDLDERKYNVKLRSVMSYWMNPKIKDWWKEINKVIIEKNVADNDTIPLIDEGCTYYSYRHSYAQSFLSKGGSVLALATLLGRSIDTISTYVQQLSEDYELVNAASIMDD